MKNIQKYSRVPDIEKLAIYELDVPFLRHDGIAVLLLGWMFNGDRSISILSDFELHEIPRAYFFNFFFMYTFYIFFFANNITRALLPSGDRPFVTDLPAASRVVVYSLLIFTLTVFFSSNIFLLVSPNHNRRGLWSEKRGLSCACALTRWLRAKSADLEYRTAEPDRPIVYKSVRRITSTRVASIICHRLPRSSWGFFIFYFFIGAVSEARYTDLVRGPREDLSKTGGAAFFFRHTLIVFYL